MQPPAARAQVEDFQVIGGSRGKWTFPNRIHLPDLTDEQMRTILMHRIAYAQLEVDGGAKNPGLEVLLRRLARARDSPGFLNAHQVHMAFQKVVSCQTARLRREGKDTGEQYEKTTATAQKVQMDWRVPQPAKNSQKDRSSGVTQQPGDLLLTEDFIGPEPANIRHRSAAWKELSGMIGLEDVKHAIMYTTPGDYIGSWLGESEEKTNSILTASEGKVLIVDDAHSFWQSHALGSGKADSYQLGVINTFVERVHNRPGEDRCVIFLGHEREMEDMFQNMNPGLRRRFPLKQAFRFTNYSDAKLLDILTLRTASQGVTADEKAMSVAGEVLRRLKDRPNFGNGGDVENLLSQAKNRAQERKGNEPTRGFNEGDAAITLTKEDFDPDWNREATAALKCQKLFDGLVSFESVSEKFSGYQRMAHNLRRRGKNPREIVPFTFLFKGPPGTGKTHTARFVGRIFYDMGLLSTTEVTECSASDLIGEYLGQTGPKVVNLFDRALGKVLFSDEAYRLAGQGRGSEYEMQAVGEIVDCMTKTKYHNKMVIVLAGYEDDMDQLMNANPGLRSWFTTDIHFSSMTVELSWEFILTLLRKEDIVIEDSADCTSGSSTGRALDLLGQLAETPGWANARELKTLAKQLVGLDMLIRER
ncbi:P-loop containing nucleoside triphosphate hydrolase protein [Cercophora newfieldiana]|uniref:P-loop containing nucleoside triphosphate hydrolase protein n=1 Tax=Cercophora newfieldiana TaxID=92897 RepID=A0AA39Y701_9PEZI|nr:P-loop containing nucleoside triphosphate hydrolase protein [Cercophora newfieldiana]